MVTPSVGVLTCIVVSLSFSLDAFIGFYLTERCCLRWFAEGLGSCHVMGKGELGVIGG